jgi:hypothetical protein
MPPKEAWVAKVPKVNRARVERYGTKHTSGNSLKVHKVFTHNEIASGKSSMHTKGDVRRVLDKKTGKTVFKIWGTGPSGATYLQTPGKASESLNLPGDLIYAQLFVTAKKVRKTPGWPRSWANFSLLQLHSHRNT